MLDLNEVIKSVKMNPCAEPRNGLVAVVRTDSSGRVGWGFEKEGVIVGDTITLSDDRTKAVVNYVNAQLAWVLHKTV